MHLGVIGHGSIGQSLIRRMPPGLVSGITVLRRQPAADGQAVRFVRTLRELIAAGPALVVECAGHQAARDHLIPLLDAGVAVIPASLGVFADEVFHRDVRDAALRSGGEVIFPSGAIGGLDILRALSGAGDVQVRYRGIKPPAAWKGSPAAQAVDLDNLEHRTVFFRGTARDAAATYPKNANVVAALALAGPGFGAVSVELVADPGAAGNVHDYEVISPACRYAMTIESAPSAGNARTSETTILSLLAEIRAFARRPGGIR